jgi:hypothetical protein
MDNLEKKIGGIHNRRIILMSLKTGGLHEKHAVASWNLGTISAFLKPKLV